MSEGFLEVAHLSVAHLSVALGGRSVLNDVTMTVRAGEFVVVVGPNGAGKTTLLRAVAGLLPASGEVLIAGVPLAKLSLRERARTIGYLPQGHVFHWPLTVFDIVALGRLPRGAGADLSEADRAAVTRAMEQTGTAEFGARAVTTLSGGERARVAMARVLAMEVPLILADEPTASLDLRHQIAVIDILRRHASSFGTVVAVLHDLALAARHADRIVVIDGGRIVADGPPREVLTAERLAETFGVRADVTEARGAPLILPWALSDSR
jgi:iron complex transport system ATP-binding protein